MTSANLSSPKKYCLAVSHPKPSPVPPPEFAQVAEEKRPSWVRRWPRKLDLKQYLCDSSLMGLWVTPCNASPVVGVFDSIGVMSLALCTVVALPKRQSPSGPTSCSPSTNWEPSTVATYSKESFINSWLLLDNPSSSSGSTRLMTIQPRNTPSRPSKTMRILVPTTITH